MITNKEAVELAVQTQPLSKQEMLDVADTILRWDRAKIESFMNYQVLSRQPETATFRFMGEKTEYEVDLVTLELFLKEQTIRLYDN